MSAVATATLPLDEYRIIRPLGAADRRVFLAHDRRLDRAVVLHLLPADPAARASLLESARALARVTHPSLGRVHRIREHGQAPCVVQSFERGASLDSLARPLPDEDVCAIGLALSGALAALHASGVAHGGVAARRVIVLPSGAPRLLGLRTARVNADARAIAADVAALLAMLVSLADGEMRDGLGRLVAGGGALSADALGRELAALGDGVQPTRTADGDAEENPYRGLRAFDAASAKLFFGRQEEIAEVLGRLESAPWVVVAAASGAGKSSLVRAGVAPAIGSLGERPRWDVVTMVPGPRPLSALAAALAPVFATAARPADALEASLRTDPGLAGRLARERTDRGLLLVVDQLEEAMTLAGPVERDAFFAVVSRFGVLAPGVRAVFTLRSDFLDQLGGVGTLARDFLRATFVLPPMGADALRLAVVGPARARGFELETPAMVDALVTEAQTDAGGDMLPLLSFVLAELWTERDRDRHVLPEAALTRLGGAAPALARHGDTVLSTLALAERQAARTVLLALVTAEGTRARRTREELVGDHGAPAERALEALIRGRLVVAGEGYEIAHEALVRAWPRLRAWLDEASDGRAAARRLAAAAAEWERLGRDAGLLWGDRQVRDLEAPGALAGADAVARGFAAASGAAVRKTRVRRWALRVGLPAIVLLVAGCIYGGLHLRERSQTRAFVAARLAEAAAASGDVTALDEEVKTAHAEAFARYDANDRPGGEKRWKEALALARRESGAFVRASAPLGLALARDPQDRAARTRAADLKYLWLLAAERDHDEQVARDLTAQLAQLDDDGSRRARLAAPAHLRVTTDASGGRSSVVLHAVHVDAEGGRVEDEGRAIELGASLELPPGSYLLTASAPGRYPTRFPVLLGRAEDAHVEIPLPASAAVPEGFVFVPAGVSLLGAADGEGVRAGLSAEPEHAVQVDAFLIGAHEVTYAEYLEYLAALPSPARAARRPHVLWGQTTEKARFALHHLADDIRVVDAVPGAKQLLKLLRNDRDGFEDFRYELRVAAAVGRSPDQKIVRLGGPAAGPDLEFIARSGHRCGVACYRAKSATPAVDVLRKALTQIARSFNRRFTFYPVAGDMLIELMFPVVPLRKTDEATACNLLYDFWLRHDVGELEREGLKVRRRALPDLPRFSGEQRRARIRFLLPMAQAERSRVLGHLGDKIPKEVTSWAGTYEGTPIFAIEQSDSIHSGRLRGDVDAIMLDEAHAFGGVLMTYYPSAEGIESVDWVPRRGASLGIDIEVRTYGTNTKVWADGCPVITVTPDHAREEWEFIQSARGTSSAVVKSLSAGSHHVRLPRLRDASRPATEDPDFQQNVRDAFERIQVEQGKLDVCMDPTVVALHSGREV